MYLLIGNKNCSRCAMTKKILDSKGIEYTYSLLDDLKEDDKEKYLALAKENGMFSMPLIIKDDKIINLQEVK